MSVQAYRGVSLSGIPGGFGFCSAFVHENGSSELVHSADHSDTWNRCSGRLQDACGSNM
jgi:hypothetical protein